MIEPSLLDWQPEPAPPLVNVSDLPPVRDEVVSELCAVASRLAAIQDPTVQDYTGFSNSDVAIGRMFVALIRAKPDDEQAIRALAGMVGHKYQRQALENTSLAMVEAFKEIASEQKLSIATRERMKSVVVINGTTDTSVEISVQGNAKIRALFEKYGAEAIESDDGMAARRVPLGHVAGLLDALKQLDATVVGTERLPDLRLIPRERMRGVKTNIISVVEIDDPGWVLLTFDYIRDPETGLSAFGEAIKTLPYADRSYSGDRKGWIVRGTQLGVLAKRLGDVGADVAQLEHYAETHQIGIPGKNGFTDRGPYIGVTLSGSTARITTMPYSEVAKNAILSLPSRKWNADAKVWEVAASGLPLLAEALRNLPGYDLSELHAAAQQSLSIVPEAPVAIVPRPEAMEKLLPHQVEGVRFLTQPLDELRRQVPGGERLRGSICGDDMGLGKTWELTVAADALTRGLKNQGKIVIVSPASVVGEWRKTIVKALGSAEQVQVAGDGREVHPFKRWNILSYDMLDSQYAKIKAMGFDVLLVDEAHNVKTMGTRRTEYVVGGNAQKVGNRWVPSTIEGLCALARERVILATGTPIPNKTKDIFQLLKGIGHPKGRSFRAFGEEYCDPQQVFIGLDRFRNPKYATTYDGATNLPELYAALKPVLIMRKMDEVLDLPPSFRDYREVKPDLKIYNKMLEDYRNSRKTSSTTADELVRITGARQAVAYAKIAQTTEFAQEFVDAGQKVIIFSAYPGVLEEMQKTFGDKAILFTGGLGQSKRDQLVQKFQTDDSVQVFLGQWQAAGEGITLTAARTTIFNEPDWVPKTMTQAERRTRRIGQTGTTHNYYMIAPGTIDEDIIAVVWPKIQNNNEFEGREEDLLRDVAQRFNKRLYNVEIGFAS